jgi:hypothetical protein
MASRSPSIFLLEVGKARDGDGLRQCPIRTSVTEDIPPPTCYADTSPPHAHKSGAVNYFHRSDNSNI